MNNQNQKQKHQLESDTFYRSSSSMTLEQLKQFTAECDLSILRDTLKQKQSLIIWKNQQIRVNKIQGDATFGNNQQISGLLMAKSNQKQNNQLESVTFYGSDSSANLSNTNTHFKSINLDKHYIYNNNKHMWNFDDNKISLKFHFPSFNFKDYLFKNSINIKQHELSKQTHRKFYHINKRNYIYKPYKHINNLKYYNNLKPYLDNLNIVPHCIKKTQGYSIPLTYAWETLTTVGAAVGTYYTYHIVDNLLTSLKGLNTVRQDVFDFFKDYAFEILGVLVIVARYYGMEIKLEDALTLLSAYVVSKTAKLYIPQLRDFISKLAPVHSNNRRTQGQDHTNFIHAAISIIGVFVLGNATEVTSSKSILSSIKSLGSTLLTVKTIESVLCTIITFLPDIIHHFLCEKFPTLSLYSLVATDKDFKLFIDNVAKLKNLDENDIFFHSHNFSQFLSAYNYMKDYMLTVNKIQRGMDILLKDIIDWMDDLYDKANSFGLIPGARHLPYVIWISGDPGIGKSACVNDLCKEYLKVLMNLDSEEEVQDEDISKFVYTYNSRNPFFDGYHNQPIFILNDYLQYTTEDEEQWLIRFVDALDVPLDVSSVDNPEKGIKGEVRFTSRLIIVTSNSNYLNTSNNITNVDAFNRRRNIVLNMTWKNGYKDVDFNNFDYSWANLRELGPLHYINDRYIAEYNNMDEVKSVLRKKYEMFNIRCTNYLAYNRSKHNGRLNSQINATHSALDLNNSILKRTYSMLTSILKYDIFGIKLATLLPILLVGTSTYVAYKTLTTLFSNKISQSLSGDSTTRKFLQNKKPLRRHAMGYTNNVYETCNVIYKNMIKITTTMATTDGRYISQSMWGLGLGGSLFLTPKHLWKRGNQNIKDGDSITVNFKDTEFKTTFKTSNLFIDINKDLACYNFLEHIPSIRSLKHLFISENNYISDTEEALLLTPRDNILNMVPVETYIVDAPYSDDMGTVYKGEQIWQYNVKMISGDCGSVLFLRNKSTNKIAGIHVAGDNYSGNSEVVTIEFINECESFFKKQTQGFSTDAIYEDEFYYDAEADLGDGFIFLGKAKQAPYQSNTTQIVKSPFFECLQPHNSEPAVLSPSDKRLETVVSPILQSVSKYGTHIKPFNSELLSQAFIIVKSFYDIIDNTTLKKFSHTDAINSKFTPYLEKLDTSTSAGFPWNTQRKSKKDLINNDNGNLIIKQELNDKLHKYENLLNNRIMFPYTLTTTLKDERVSLEKVKIGKTRTFMNFPVEYTILMRSYFDDFIDKETQYARNIGTTVGINIYSSQWNLIHYELSKFDYTLDGDFKAFDGTIRPEFFNLYAKLVNNFYKDEFSNHRHLLVQGCCFAPIFVLDKVYMKLQGNPSGSRITTSFNSFVNRMYVVMSILKVLPNNYKTIQFFKDNIKIYAHGDDHLIGFSKLLKQYWDAFAIRDFLLLHNINYTSSKKDQPLVSSTPLDNCYYLKSHFVWDKENKIYKAGLDKTVIQEMISWQRDHDDNSTKMIINTCLRYAYFWGYDYFLNIKQQIQNHMKLRHMLIDLVVYEDLDIEYLHTDQLEFKYN